MDRLDRILNTQIELDEWLELMRHNPHQAPFYGMCFPNESVEKDFLADTDRIGRTTTYRVLENFLLPSAAFPQHDLGNLEHLKSILAQEADPVAWLANHPYYTRLLFWSHDQQGTPPWEGITWVLELLPDNPKRAIEMIETYLFAHFVFLPDWPISGLLDAMKVIRTKFIGIPGSNLEKVDFLLKRESRDFEYIIAQLYNRMGYTTSLTKATRDGGKDVIAARETCGQQEVVAVECKLYNKIVGVRTIRELKGVIGYGGYNKGVIFTTKDFSRDARKLVATDHTIELVARDRLVLLLNEFFGIDWPNYIETIIFQSRREHS